MIEFLFAAPLLLLLVFGVSEIGRLIQHYEILTKSVRVAARYAAGQTTGSLGTIVLTPALKNDIQNLAVYGTTGSAGAPLLPGMSTTDVAVSESAPRHVQVTVNYTYQPLWGGTIPSFGLGSDISLTLPMTASSVMRVL
jgi:Flp pilus assembly protein TadG